MDTIISRWNNGGRNDNMANNTRKILVWQDILSRGILKTTVVGHFAMWAVRQSPHLLPEDLNGGIEEFNDALDFGDDDYLSITCNNLKRIVCDAISKSETIGSWNVPKKGDPMSHVCVTRYDQPDPDHDIIDLHALARNIAHSVWLEICYDDGFFEHE